MKNNLKKKHDTKFRAIIMARINNKGLSIEDVINLIINSCNNNKK